MNFTRRLGALALTLVLGACSTPADLAVPTLEPQFGTGNNDFGSDVTLTSSGSIVALTSENWFESEYDDPYSGSSSSNAFIYWDQYDKNGNFVKQTVVDGTSCSYRDYDSEDCSVSHTPKTIVADTKGFTYVLGTDTYFYSGFYDYIQSSGQYVYKIDASGSVVRRTTIGFHEGDGYANPSTIDLAVDASGNIYVAGALIDSNGELVNAVAKYSTTGTRVWQRTSPVGLPYGVTVSSNGNVYVAGSGGVAKFTNSGNQSWKISGDTRDIAAVGTNTVYARNLTTVRKLDANGKQLWSKAQTGLSGLVIADMTVDSSANVYITGKYNASSTNRDVFTRKLSASSGATSFSKTFGTSAYDDARGIATVSGSEIYLTGATQGSLAHPFRGGENDGYLRKLSSSGTPVWTR